MKLISPQMQNDKFIVYSPPEKTLNLKGAFMRLPKTVTFPSFSFRFLLSLFFLFLVSCSGGGSGGSSSNSKSNTACDIENGVGEKTNSTGESPEHCELVSCNAGYTKDDGECHATEPACTDDDLVKADAHGAEGTKTYQEDTNDYTACVLTSCTPNYTLTDGICYENNKACNDPEVENVHAQGLAATKPYQAGTAGTYGDCVLTSCNSSYTLGGDGRCHATRVDCIGASINRHSCQWCGQDLQQKHGAITRPVCQAPALWTTLFIMGFVMRTTKPVRQVN